MKKKSFKTVFIIYISLFITLMLTNGVIFGVSQDEEEYYHSGDYDDPKVISSLDGAEITWKIVNASGVFADEDMQPGDLIRYKVTEANTRNNKYKVKEKTKFWGDNDFDDYGEEGNADYLLVQRYWGKIAIKYFASRAQAYWGNLEEIDQNFEAFYESEWWEWKFMNTVTIKFLMNKSNYDIIKYSRAEGILLSRTAVVNTYDGDVKGYLHIVLHEYSEVLAPSPWFYVIITLIIVAFVATIIITISLLIQRRKRMWREIDEI